MGLGWGFGEGKSISLIDHALGKPVISEMLHGKSYEDKYAGIYAQAQQSKLAANAALYKGLSAINQGYGSAQQAIQQQGAVATKQLMDSEREAIERARQDMIARGMNDPVALAGITRGLQGKTSDALNQLNALIAGQNSNVRIAQGQDRARIHGAISQNEMGLGAMGTQIGLNTQYGQQGGILGDVLGLVGMLYGGGMFGGGGGSGGGASGGYPLQYGSGSMVPPTNY